MTINDLKTNLATALDIPSLNAAWPLVENWATQQLDLADRNKKQAVDSATQELSDLKKRQSELVAQAKTAVASGDLEAIHAVIADAEAPALELKKAVLAKSIEDLQKQLAGL